MEERGVKVNLVPEYEVAGVSPEALVGRRLTPGLPVDDLPRAGAVPGGEDRVDTPTHREPAEPEQERPLGVQRHEVGEA